MRSFKSILKTTISVSIFFLFVNKTEAQVSSNKQTFLLFWKSDCDACHIAIPQLVKKMETLDSTKYRIIAVSFDTDSADFQQAIKDLNMQNFEHRYDFKAGYAKNDMAKKYHVSKTPTLICLDNEENPIAEGNDAFYRLVMLKP